MLKLSDYAAIVVSISGGKDSQVCCDVISRMVKDQQYAGSVVYVHSDTKAEWSETLPHCQYLSQAYGIPLHVASPIRGLPLMIEQRCRKLQEQGRKGGWPSASCRYCTSDAKRGPIQKVLRSLFPVKVPQDILMVTGERRQESSHRAKLPEFNAVKQLCTGCRKVVNWRPILDFTVEDVWNTISASGLHRHVAYDLGNERLSCAICVLAKESDIRNGAKACPELAETFLRIERETGHTFRHNRSLASILEPQEDFRL